MLSSTTQFHSYLKIWTEKMLITKQAANERNNGGDDINYEFDISVFDLIRI